MIKQDDRETYDTIFDVAFILSQSDEDWMRDTGKLLFSVINDWEKGKLRDNIQVISATFDVAMAYNQILEQSLDTTLKEVMDAATSPENS